MGLNSKLLPDSLLRCFDKSERDARGMFTAAESAEREALKLETALQTEIGNYLRINDIPFYRTRTDRKTTGTLGWPDITFVMRGRAYFFEVKRPGKEPEPHQLACHAALRAAGAQVWVPTSLRQAIDIVRQLREETP